MGEGGRGGGSPNLTALRASVCAPAQGCWQLRNPLCHPRLRSPQPWSSSDSMAAHGTRGALGLPWRYTGHLDFCHRTPGLSGLCLRQGAPQGDPSNPASTWASTWPWLMSPAAAVLQELLAKEATLLFCHLRLSRGLGCTPTAWPWAVGLGRLRQMGMAKVFLWQWHLCTHPASFYPPQGCLTAALGRATFGGATQPLQPH